MWATNHLIPEIERAYQKASPQLREEIDRRYSVLKYDLTGMASGFIAGGLGATVLADESTLAGTLAVTAAILGGGYAGSKIGKALQRVLYRSKDRVTNREKE